MNYRHIYHAGNFADVFKHCILIAILESFQHKETPICYLETHAGRGLYELKSIRTKKEQEYLFGIEKIIKHRMINPIINRYLEIVKAFHYPEFYPGSPIIAKSCLRTQDSMILIEFHPEEVKELKELFKYNANCAVHFQDGYLGLKAFLPPKERRGCILIDPPFEKKEEWTMLLKNLPIALNRFKNGVYAIWYPLKDKKVVQDFKNQLLSLNLGEVLMTEITIYPTDVEVGLAGCGMAIINPPWQLETNLQGFVPILWHIFSNQAQGHYIIENYNNNK